ncbi:MAG: outer membrane lipid asymmetry maintenance protein MlaD [Geminicoccaceae bacterium]|nr:outer membrane lipid asymmetry maintenance protein MlaD [Geminicoccaceae bacterium]
MSRNLVETVLGAVVIVVAIAFLAWAYGRSNVGMGGGLDLVATFDKADGIAEGSDVRISGIPVGQVTGYRLDPKTYRADVSFSVNEGIDLPADTSASIVSASLLGGKYLALQPGADDVMLKSGDRITFTQSAVSLEELIGKYIFSGGGGASTAPAPAPAKGGGNPFGDPQ